MLGFFGCTAKSDIRPEVTAGPIDLNCRLEKISELKALDSATELDCFFFCANEDVHNNTDMAIGKNDL